MQTLNEYFLLFQYVAFWREYGMQLVTIGQRPTHSPLDISGNSGKDYIFFSRVAPYGVQSQHLIV